uniref:Interleukin 1 receptor type 1 n=1 Tax=Apteryx owenii TaxID=8824 RepID=A0A8B9PPL9_APTOW
MNFLVPAGQPLAINCSLENSLNFQSGDYNLTWYKVGNQTSVPRDKLSRIHQQKSLIWFLPAMLEDSGDYECVLRVDGLCLNEKFAVEELIFTLSPGRIVCPHLDYFRDEKNTLPVRWYKDCQLLEGKRFSSFNRDLVIFNVTLHDKGNYTCKTSYTYNGKQYNISRDIILSVEGKCLHCCFVHTNDSPKYKNDHCQAVVVKPCQKSQWFCWSTCHFFDREETSPEGQPVLTVKLIISEVYDEDYEQPFVCHASNTFGQVASYIILKHRGKEFLPCRYSDRYLNLPPIAILNRPKLNLVIKACYCFLFSNRIFLFVLDEKIYDAYVLYPKGNGGSSSYPLETFVFRILPDVLERQCGYNLFILGRDDLPGEAVVSVADETLKQSRRLMIILGSETSSCCLLEDASEQQLTMYNALILDGIKVILIEMDEIQDYTSMPESIRYIKQKHGAIQWKGDFSEKSCSAYTRFWKNVRYQMPSRKNISYSEVYLFPKTLNKLLGKTLKNYCLL